MYLINDNSKHFHIGYTQRDLAIKQHEGQKKMTNRAYRNLEFMHDETFSSIYFIQLFHLVHFTP